MLEDFLAHGGSEDENTEGALFKGPYVSRVGLGVALEALRDYLWEEKGSVDDLFRYADICQVQGVMRPYLEAMMA
jgi:hypothetical protein